MRLRAVVSSAADSLCECSEQAACERHSELSGRMLRYIQFHWTRISCVSHVAGVTVVAVTTVTP